MKNNIRYIIILVLFVVLGIGKTWGQTSITAIGTSVTQNFDGLTTSTSYQTWTNNSTLAGWYTKTDATSPTQYKANTGANTTASLYSFGTTGLAERAFGYCPSDAYTGTSGVGNGYMGWRLKNNTTKSIGSIRVVWTGEQWRKAVDANIQYIKLSYQIASSVTSLTSGTYILTNSEFASPIHNSSSAATLDGNLAANRTTDITFDVNVVIPAGDEIMLRWEDLNDPANHSLAIDDVSFTALKESQTITFNTLADKTYGDADFSLTASASSGLSVSYSSSNTSVATISSGNIVTIIGAGTTTITASQSGDGTFTPAIPIERVLNVKPQTPVATDATSILPVSFQSHWNSASGAQGYYLYYGTDPTLVTYTAASVGLVNTFNVTSLIPNTTYYYRLKAINTGIYSDYSNIISVTTSPGIQTYNITATPTFTTATLNWSNGNLSSRAVFMKEGIGDITLPDNNYRYYESTDWDNKVDQLGESGYYCIYYGTESSVELTNLYPGTTYTVQAFEFSGVEWEESYLTSISGANNPITFVPWPTTTFTNTTAGQITPEAWNTTARWDHATVPTNSLHPAVLVYIDGNCEVTDVAECNNLTILASHGGTNSKLTINPSKSMIVGGGTTAGALVNEAGAGGLVIKTDPTQALANGSLIYKKTDNPTVAATVEMYSKASWNASLSNTDNSKYKWQYFGIPVTQLNTRPTFDGVYVRRWDETGTAIYNHWVSLTNSDVLSAFTGYEICQLSPKTYSFTGDLVNANFSKTNLVYTSTALYPGQHIFANPYTAAINIASLITTGIFGANMESSVYLYNTGSFNEWYNSTNTGETIANTGTGAGQYTVSTPATVGQLNVPTQIPSMQAFLVKAKSNIPADNSLVFNYADVVGANTELQRAPAANKTSSSNSKTGMRIDVLGTHYSDKMWIFTDSTCTRKYDRGWDGSKLFGSPRTPQIFAIEPDGNYQINAVADMNNTDLGFQAGDDKEFTMRFTHENVDKKYANIYLLDMVAKTTTDITISGSEYKFTAEANGKAEKRFKIITRKINENATDDASRMKIYSANGVVFVQNNSNEAGDVKLYSMAGKLVQQFTYSANNTTSAFTNLTSGVYLAKTISNGIETSSRIIVP